MLTFFLNDVDIGAEWRAAGDGYECGESYIRPFRHAALESVAVTDGSRLLVQVRERSAGRSGAELAAGVQTGRLTPVDSGCFARLAEQLREWPLQWQMLVIDAPSKAKPRSEESVLARLEAGQWGTAPVFLVSDHGKLWGDWDAGRLLHLLPRKSLDPARATRYLTEYANPYARVTLFRGLQLLTERSRAEWAGRAGCETLRIDYPEPWYRPRAGELCDDADPVEAFETIVSSSLRRWMNVSEEHLGAELSGGLDSAIVAGSAAALCKRPLRSYGIALMGDSREDQPERRAELAQCFGLIDTEVPIASFLPIAPGSCRLDGRAPMLPWEEGYHEVFWELLGKASGHGIEVLLTGFGGDELCGLRPSELRAIRGESAVVAALEENSVSAPSFLTPSARATLGDDLDEPPRAPCSDSAVECAAYSAARYMRRGIWPVHPMCTPELVHFCAHLPAEWRYRRRIERELLARRGCSDRVIYPRERDDFSFALAATLRGPARPLVERLFANPALHELGIVDAGRLRSAYAAWCEGGPRDEAVQYFAAAVTELCLQPMV
ncbi:MAG: asparagine synthase-related protein [Terracidiphilus sp.]